jgi:hypothetical protein
MRADGRPRRRRPDGVIRRHPSDSHDGGVLVRISTAEVLGAEVVDAVRELERTADTVLSGTLVDRADLDRVLTTLRRLRAKVVSVDVAP